jgi:hypothetical protein
MWQPANQPNPWHVSSASHFEKKMPKSDGGRQLPFANVSDEPASTLSRTPNPLHILFYSKWDSKKDLW